ADTRDVQRTDRQAPQQRQVGKREVRQVERESAVMAPGQSRIVPLWLLRGGGELLLDFREAPIFLAFERAGQENTVCGALLRHDRVQKLDLPRSREGISRRLGE